MRIYSKKHYEDVARVIRNAPVPNQIPARTLFPAAYQAITELLSAMFQDDSPRFDPDKFYKACGWH